MKRFSATLFVLVAVLLIGGATQAFAWENGGGADGNNAYGTHDWILDHAIRAAGDDGAWVDRKTALLASDNPDTYNTSKTYHLFYENGSRRGAPQEVASLYYKAVRAYQQGDESGRIKASYYLGVLSHYYADVCQPFHSTKSALDYRSTTPSYHRRYEHEVEERTRNYDDRRAWFTSRERRPVVNVRDKTVAAAEYARGKFPSLIKDFIAHGSVNTDVTGDVTHDVLSRASNDLADLIVAIPQGEGVAAAPAQVEASMWRQCPAQNQGVRADARCVDANGEPLEAVKVVFKWSLSSGTKYTAAYTDETGYAYSWFNVGKSPLMTKIDVREGAASSGATTYGYTWFMTSPKLDDGQAGIKTTLSTTSPSQNSNVSAATVVHDTSGRVVKGLPITFIWTKIGGEVVTFDTFTDSSGVARHTLNIGAAPKGEVVSVRAQTQSGGINRSSTRTFTPR